MQPNLIFFKKILCSWPLNTGFYFYLPLMFTLFSGLWRMLVFTIGAPIQGLAQASTNIWSVSHIPSHAFSWSNLKWILLPCDGSAINSALKRQRQADLFKARTAGQSWLCSEPSLKETKHPKENKLNKPDTLPCRHFAINDVTWCFCFSV